MGLGLLAGLGKALMTGGKLTALGSIVGQGAVGLGSNMLTNRGALRRQQLADQNNIRFWKMQNEYNTPANQMKRLQDAGLNPNLIYGSGSANTGVAGSIAPSKPAPYNIKNPVPLQAMLLQSQIANLDSVTEKNRAETEKTLGLTPSLIKRSDKQLEILTEQKLQQAVKTGQITEQEKAKTKSLIAKAQIDVQNEGFNKAYTKFKSGLLNMGVDPQGSIWNTLIKFFANMFSNKKSNFLTNPQEKFNN